MNYEEYQQQFEHEAVREKDDFDGKSVPDLLALVTEGDRGSTYQFWASLSERAKPEEANRLLLSFLESDADFLDRYHCAKALIAVNGLYLEWDPVKLSGHEKYPVNDYIAELRNVLACV